MLLKQLKDVGPVCMIRWGKSRHIYWCGERFRSTD